MGLTNTFVAKHMDALFGKERADRLRKELPALPAEHREQQILQELMAALRDRGGVFVVPFCFKMDDGSKTSHYLIFVCKDFKGFEIMRDIMASYSTGSNDGVPSFIFNPIEKQKPLLFSSTKSVTDLEKELLEAFAERTLPMKEIDKEHSKNALYLSRNYKEALRRLESRGNITAAPKASERRVIKGEVSFADSVVVTFPKR